MLLIYFFKRLSTAPIRRLAPKLIQDDPVGPGLNGARKTGIIHVE